MKIETSNLNINDISAAKKYSEMDACSLASYIGKVILSIKSDNLNECLFDIIKNIIEVKTNLDDEKIVGITKNLTEQILIELSQYKFDQIKYSEKEQNENLIEPLIDKIAFILDEDINKLNDANKQKLFSIGIVVDAVNNNEMPTTDFEKANEKEKLLPDDIKQIISNMKKNIINKASNLVSKVNNSRDFMLKSTFGLIADLFGGNLVSKLVYKNVIDSPEMLEKIINEGIIHFTSEYTADKILNSDNNYIKASGLVLSAGKKRTFFFGGIPSFKDITINIYSYNVMTGLRIRPTEEQIKKLIYREYNDKAVAYNGNFHFNKDQIEKVYFGLKLDENQNMYYEEISEQEAKNYKICNELKNMYNGDGSIRHKVLCNAYSFYYEFENYQNLLKRISKNFTNNNDKHK